MKKQCFSVSLLLLLLLSFPVISGCDYITGEAIKPVSSPAIVNNITPEEALVFKMTSCYFPTYLLDVRTPAEYATGHIAGAINIDYNSPDFKSNIDRLDRSAVYIVYCKSGNRSAKASQIMAENGFEHILNVTGGFDDLAAQGFLI